MGTVVHFENSRCMQYTYLISICCFSVDPKKTNTEIQSQKDLVSAFDFSKSESILLHNVDQKGDIFFGGMGQSLFVTCPMFTFVFRFPHNF